MNYSNHPVTKEFRQLLRKTETPMEKKLWKYLRNRQLDMYFDFVMKKWKKVLKKF